MINFPVLNADSRTISAIEAMIKEFNFLNLPKQMVIIWENNSKFFKIQVNGDKATIYTSKRVELFYGLFLLNSNYKGKDLILERKSAFLDMCYMLDCSRNAVPKISSVKKLILYLASMGYDSLQLYTEDTLEIDGEPYFGYMRGKFTNEEIREIDTFAIDFGIELVPCIQTLAHFNGITRHAAYGDIFDIHDILLVGEDKTYRLLDKILSTVSKCFSSKKINIGMDEAYLIGRGRHFDRNSNHNKFDIMTQHLGKVNELCKKYNFKPMMWSDMFFALTFNSYYEESGKLSKELKDKIPTDVDLVYWDYYHTDYDSYDSMLKRHLDFDNQIIFAGGGWKWNGYAPDNRYSIASNKAAIAACKANAIKKVIITGWGDNGGECSTFAILPSLLYFSHLNYGGVDIDENYLELFKSMTGISYEMFMKLDLPNQLSERVEDKNSASKYLLFNDVLSGIMDSTVECGYNNMYKNHYDELIEVAKKAGKWGYLFETLAYLCKILSNKAEIGIIVRNAYKAKDNLKLKEIVITLQEILNDIDKLYDCLYTQWNAENKPNGFDVQDLRIGGLKQRLNTAKRKIQDYVSGKTAVIEELDEIILDYYGGGENLNKKKDTCEYRWKMVSSVNVND